MVHRPATRYVNLAYGHLAVYLRNFLSGRRPFHIRYIDLYFLTHMWCKIAFHKVAVFLSYFSMFLSMIYLLIYLHMFPFCWWPRHVVQWQGLWYNNHSPSRLSKEIKRLIQNERFGILVRKMSGHHLQSNIAYPTITQSAYIHQHYSICNELQVSWGLYSIGGSLCDNTQNTSK